MDFTLSHNFSDNNPSAVDWNALLAESVTHVPFLRHEYLRAWWETRGGGEWPQSDLVLVTARRSKYLAGIAPLFFTHNLEGLPSLMLLGSIEISDYLDLIVRPADLTEFVRCLFDFLAASPDPSTGSPVPAALAQAGQSLPAWRVLDWQNILETSPTLPVLKAEAEAHGWTFSQERTYHAPAIPLPGDFETYLCGIDKKQRHEIRRKMRRAEEAGNVRWYITNDAAALDAEVDAFLSLMANDPAKEKFLTEAMRQQMHSTCRLAFENGWLQLAFLEADGQKAAGYLNFDYQDRIWVYNSGVDRRFLELSPGWVLLGHLLQWANENKRREFDFMRGEEDYKYKFGAVDRFVVRARVER
jgi:CelD/BcsL family acetyltransferase involved in cellulose biosynthesis